MMKSAIIGLLAETSIHPGTEQSTSVIDLPVAREKATGYPVIIGSSMKGALRELASHKLQSEGDVNKIFGQHENAGAMMVSDARLLLLPVRSLTGHFKWVTCPYLLERYKRDRLRVGLPCNFKVPDPPTGHGVTAVNQPKLFLEELTFEIQVENLDSIVQAISELIYHRSVQERLINQLVILSDDEFKYFAEFALQINARNVLDEETKASKNLWYEETLPPDSLFFSLLIARPGTEKENALDLMQALFTQHPYLQVGGNETIGQGWCAVAWLEGGQNNG